MQSKKEELRFMRTKLTKKITTAILVAGFAMSSFSGMAGIENVYAESAGRQSDKAYVNDSQSVLSDVLGESKKNASTSVITIKDYIDWNSFATQCSSSNNYYSGTTVKLTDDISFDGVSLNNFERVGRFDGTFDGCGHSISGMITSGGGLFNTVSNGAVIKNVTVIKSDFECESRCDIGAVANNNSGLINNCHVKSSKIINSYSDDSYGRYSWYVGGIVGDNYEGTIKNCTVSSDVEIKSSYYAGGISGGDNANAGTINNCANMGSVTGKYAGGLAGRVRNINNSYNIGKVTDSSTGKMGAAIAYSANDVVFNCYYSVESSELSIINAGSSTNRIEHFKASEMQTDDFCSKLNSRRGTNKDWFEWERTTSSAYPVIVKLKDLGKCNISMNTTNVTYTGEEVTPAVTVTDGGKTLVKDTDYTVTYSNNKEIGTAKAIIEGTGMYMNSIERTFQIVKGNPVISWSQPKASYVAGANGFNLNVQATKGETGVISYSSSNTKVVSVYSNGYVSINGPGKAVITVKTSGDEYWNGTIKKATILVKPAKPANLKVRPGKRMMTISWNKASGVSGYEYQYSLKKNFAGAKKINTKKGKVVVKKLKRGKKYYVRVRAYKLVNGKKVYSAWSKSSVKVK